MKAIYVAGPIFGTTDEVAHQWRLHAREALGEWYTILNPMDRDYRGKENENVARLVEDDLTDIQASDIVLACVLAPSWGTAMEIRVAWELRKTIIGWGTSHPSPWLQYHTTVLFGTLEEALAFLRGAK
jgi:nucleoside 2-deoxyribosyltransferase